MTNFIEYVFEEQDIVVKAEFIEEAPIGAQILWDLLEKPLTSEVKHGKWAGPEVYITIPKPPEELPDEYLIATPIPGDIIYVEVPKSPVRGLSGFHEFAMFYGREGRALMLQAGILYGYRHRLVATIADKANLKLFAQACENVHGRNPQRVTVRRALAA